MLAAQQAYGPDRLGLWSEPGLSLGHRLFKLVPEDAHDQQPLVSASGRYVLTADIRLDNREDMAERLGVAHEHAGLSDADLLARGLDRYGEAVLDHIVADFAFAAWDRVKRQLILARDPLGQRPLFYYRNRDFCAFSSMPKGLHALEEVPRAPNERRLAEFLCFVPAVGSETQFRELERVPTGHVVIISESMVASRRYWQPQRRELRLSNFDEYREAFRAELDRAVRSRLRGAGEAVATHLSAGWDSSSVTATAARLRAESGGRVLAFTAVPREGNSSGAPFRRIANEGAIAAETAAMYPNVEHILMPGTAASPIARLNTYFTAFERPLYNLCNMVWLTDIRSAAQKEGVRVLLTGENGNWTISASPVTLLADFIRERRFRQWWREAKARRKGGARYRGIAASSFGPWLPHLVWNRFRSFSSRPEASAYAALHPRWQAHVEKEMERHSVGLSRPAKDSFAGAIRFQSTQYDFGELRKGALAGWGIDERDPTADRRLIEFCLSLPIDMLLKDGVRRPLARAALSDRLPAAVLDQGSKGYQAADWHEGMTGDLGSIAALLEEIAADPTAASLVDVASMRRWIRNWPREGWERPEVMARYRGALLGALAVGHFVLSASRR
jgi:asparagine synthase (glutamine-hydrolysing)